jgi:hypothetical protein
MVLIRSNFIVAQFLRDIGWLYMALIRSNFTVAQFLRDIAWL